MTGPEAGPRAHYVTACTRADEVRDLYGREPTANELRALAELPLEKSASKFHLNDDSETGRRIIWLLERSERNRDVSLLEEAGKLLMEQSTRLPRHWRSPAISAPPILHSLPDDVYQFSPMSNDPFGKVGFAKVVESKAKPPLLSISNEPQHTPYPELLVNSPERWIRQSPKDPQPMTRPKPFSSSYSWLDQQVEHQLGTTAINNVQKLPYGPVKPKPVKAVDPYRVRKPIAAPKPRAQVIKTQPTARHPSGLHGVPQFPITPTNPYFSVPEGQKESSGYVTNAYAYQRPSSTNTYPTYQAVPAGSVGGPVNSAGKPRNQTPYPGVPVYYQSLPPPKFEHSTHPASRAVTNQQPYAPTTYPFSQLPAIRIPTTPLIPSSQGQVPWIMTNPDSSRRAAIAANPTETNSYDEVFRRAQETADSLAKMLGKK